MNIRSEIRPYWSDPRLHELPGKPWRKIHLDFHNSQHMPKIGADFDPDEFGDRLVDARVNAIVVFAKDMHGYFYCPSEYGPVHPGLSFDLMGQQIEACKHRGIKVYTYYCVTWDNYLAERHPEWLVFKRDRTTYLPKFDETPGWTALCLSHGDLVELVLAHSRELVSRYKPDGVWYDMPLPIGGECFCPSCLRALREQGMDPLDVQVQRGHKQQLLTDFMHRAHELAHSVHPDCQVDQNNQTRLGLGDRAVFLDNVEIESLPTGHWGYLYFPVEVRYARNFGVSTYGQTGRFHRSWADFGGLKHPNQLRVELARIVAQGARCGIGDQAPPSGRLDPGVYETIGQCYSGIERLEPYLEGAAPVVEAAILVDGLPLTDFGTTGRGESDRLARSVLGMAKLLVESRIQFDVVEADADLERYRLIVLPDGLPVDSQPAAKLRSYLDGGGAIIASHDALRIEGTDEIWAESLGITYAGESPFVPAYLKLDPALSGGIPDYEYALYEGTAQWRHSEGDGSETLGRVGEPLFQRSAEHYTSHAQTPYDHTSDFVAVVARGRLAATAFPLGRAYYRHGYWVYRELFKRLADRVLPERLVRTNAPISTEVSVTHQHATHDHPERWMVHVVNFSPNLRTPEHLEYTEDPIPLHNVEVELLVTTPVQRAYLAEDGSELALDKLSGGWRVRIPKIGISAVAVLECGPSEASIVG